MRKSWVLAIVFGMFMFVTKAMADGSFVNAPGPIIAANGQNYNYPAAASPTAGGLLVNDGVGTYRYSNAVIQTTNSLVALQFPTLPSITKAQELLLTAATTGQFVFCSDCANAGSSKGTVCLSTGSTTQGQFVTVSSATACQ